MMRMNKLNYHILFEQAGVVATLSAYAIFSPQRHDKLKNWTDKTKKWIDRVSKNLIVVSVLITTIAFSAAFNMPGSYNGNGAANLRQKKAIQHLPLTRYYRHVDIYISSNAACSCKGS
jgi:Domain of unknown function